MGEHRFRCGDVARILDEDWDMEVAYADYASGRASWCGWPEGAVEISKLTLVKACTDDEHRTSVARWLDGAQSQSSDHRRDTIELLYRPRAHWTRIVASAREQARAAREHLDRCEASLHASMLGPADVEPIATALKESGQRG